MGGNLLPLNALMETVHFLLARVNITVGEKVPGFSANCSHYHKTLVGGLADGGDTNHGVIHTGWYWWEEVAREAGTWLA